MNQPLTCISVGSDGTVFGIDPQSNVLQASPAPPWTQIPGQASTIAVADDGTVLAQNLSGDIVQFDHTSNSWIPFGSSEVLSQISAGSAQNIWGINYGLVTQSQPNVYQYADSQWTPLPVIILTQISATADGSVFGVDTAGYVQQYNSSAQSWQKFSAQPPEPLRSLSAGSGTMLWGISQLSTVYQYDSLTQQWNTIAGPVPVNATDSITLNTVSCGSDGTVWGIGSDSNAYFYDFISSDWTPAPSLPSDSSTTTSNPVQIAIGAVDSVWCVDTNNNIFQYTDGDYNWSTIQANSGWKQLSVGSATNIWGTDGDKVYQVTGGAGNWTPSTTIDVSMDMVSVGDDGTLWGVGGGQVYQYTGETFVNVPFASAAVISGPTPSQAVAAVQVSVGNAQDIWVISSESSNNGYQYTGSSWDQIPGPALSCISVASDGSVWGVSGGVACLFYSEPDGWTQTALEVEKISTANISDIWCIDGNGNGINVLFQPGEGSVQAIGSGSRLRWDAQNPFDETQSTHLWIVNRGAILANLATANDQQAGSAFFNLFNPQTSATGPTGNTFHDRLCQGLYDADWEWEYNNNSRYSPTILTATYKSHFYDPDTGTNYKGETSPTALTQSRRFFWDAIYAYRENDLSEAGYKLGLALHYFTDLTQPMHAGNFTYLDSRYWGYHTGFEQWIMKHQASVATPTEYVPFGQVAEDPTDYLINAARNSKTKYFADICDKGTVTHYTGSLHGNDTTLLYYMPLILTDAIIEVSQYLVAWMTWATNEEAWGFLINTGNGLAMDAADAKRPTAKGQIEQNVWSNSSTQKFLIQPLSGDDSAYCQIIAMHGVLDIGKIPESGIIPIVTNTWGGTGAPDTQKWFFAQNADEVSMVIQNKLAIVGNEMGITAPDSNARSGLIESAVQTLSSQSWIFVPTTSAYKILRAGGTIQLVLEMPSDKPGTNLWLNTPGKNSSGQEFLWVPLPDEADEYYALLAAASGLALWMVQNSDGTYAVEQQPWNLDADNADAMKWAREDYDPENNVGLNEFIRNKAFNVYMYTPPDTQDSNQKKTPIGGQAGLGHFDTHFIFNLAVGSDPEGTPITDPEPDQLPPANEWTGT